MNFDKAKKEIVGNERKSGKKDLFSRRILNSIIGGSLKGGAGRKRKRSATPATRNVSRNRNTSHLEKDTHGFIVHIDQEHGWDRLILAYKPLLHELLNHPEIGPQLNYIDGWEEDRVWKHVLSAVEQTLMRWQSNDRVLYAQLQNIANILEISVFKLFLIQVMYEANTLCTSVVIRTNTGKIAHGRTMDWPMPILEKLSVPVSLYCNNKKIGASMHWLGCVGMFTVMRDKSYSISINYRRFNERDELKDAERIIRQRFNWLDYLVQGANWALGFGNVDIVETMRSYGVPDISIIVLSKYLKSFYGAFDATPVTFLMRRIMMEESTYQGAVNRLKVTPLFSQIYFTIAGTNNNQGKIIARSTLEVDGTKTLSPSVPFIVQPNMDWWDSRAMDIMDSKKRIRVMNGVLRKSCTVDTLWNTMKKGGNQHICNDITVYSTLFVPSESHFAFTVGN